MTVSPYPIFLTTVFLSLFAFYLSDRLKDGWTYILSGKTLGRILSLCFAPVILLVIAMSVIACINNQDSMSNTLWVIVLCGVFWYALFHMWNRWLFVFNTTTKNIHTTLQALPGYRLRTEEEIHLSRMDDPILPETTVVVGISGTECVLRVSQVFGGMCWLRSPGNGMKQEKQVLIATITENIEAQFCSSSKQLGAYLQFYGVLSILFALAKVLL